MAWVRQGLEKIADAYYDPFWFEKGTYVHRALGVQPFRWLVMNTVGKFREKTDCGKPSNYFIGQRANQVSVESFLRWTRWNEAIHMALVLPALFNGTLQRSVEHLSRGEYGSALLDASGLLLNGYCVLLQRYNRTRILEGQERRELLLSRRKARRQAAQTPLHRTPSYSF